MISIVNILTLVVICSALAACSEQTDSGFKQEQVEQSENMEGSAQKFAISLVVKKSHRNEKSMGEIIDLLEQLQLPVTGHGAATISVRARKEMIEQVFKFDFSNLDQNKNVQENSPIDVPENLSTYIENISMEQKHQYFDD